jgi:hypothetical protein
MFYHFDSPFSQILNSYPFLLQKKLINSLYEQKIYDFLNQYWNWNIIIGIIYHGIFVQQNTQQQQQQQRGSTKKLASGQL